MSVAAPQVLLQELQGLVGGDGEGGDAAPGSSLMRPLHVVLQVGSSRGRIQVSVLGTVR